MLATGIVPTLGSVAARTMKPLPVTPATFDVSSNTARMPSCCINDRSVFVAWAKRRHRQIDAGAVELNGSQ